MAESVITSIRTYNLVSYYLLPLIQLNRFMFGEDNFINSYVASDGSHMHVQVKDLHDNEIPYKNQWFYTVHQLGDRNYFTFVLPRRWKATFDLFREGKYSEFSEYAKEYITSYSGLQYQELINGIRYTDARLMALYRNNALRNMLAEELAVDPSLLQGELITPPPPDEFLDLVV